MTAEDLRFKEIEHKYLVDDRFDVQGFRDALAALHPMRTKAMAVRDRYYLTVGGRAGRYVIRHRFDAELHHLTVKSIADDTEVRVEVNLDLGHHAGDQHAQVEAFVAQLGVEWSGTIEKDLEVWDFPESEVVHYRASTGSRSVRCVEFEATRKTSVQEALAAVDRYERATGFDRERRSRQSLLQILFPEIAKSLGLL
jgi:adenylate cyclase class IV